MYVKQKSKRMSNTIGNNYGLNNNFDYQEIEFDSRDTQNTLFAAIPPDPLLGNTSAIRAANANNILNWPLFTMGRPISGIAAFKIIEAEIPFSFYIINSTNDTFQLVEQGGGMTFTITVPHGNYTTSTLASALQGLFNGTTSYVASGSPQPYTITYNNTIGKFIFDLNITTNSTTFLDFFTGGVSVGPYTALGFLGGNTAFQFLSVTGPGAFNFRLIAPFVAQVTGPNYLYINSSLQGQQVGLYLPDGSFTKGQIGPQMAKVPITVNPGGVIFYKDPDPQKWFDVENQVNLVNMDLYCTLGNLPDKIDFNGTGFSIKLGLLLTRTQRTDNLSSLTSEGRISKRMKPQ